MPAVCAGIVAALPPAAAARMKAAVLKVVLQLLAVLQLPPWQHWRALAPGVASPDKVTTTFAPSAAAAWLSVVVATPLRSKVTLVAPSVPALAASVAVCPLIVVTGFVHGALVSAQAVTVTVRATQARLAGAIESS